MSTTEALAILEKQSTLASTTATTTSTRNTLNNFPSSNTSTSNAASTFRKEAEKEELTTKTSSSSSSALVEEVVGEEELVAVATTKQSSKSDVVVVAVNNEEETTGKIITSNTQQQQFVEKEEVEEEFERGEENINLNSNKSSQIINVKSLNFEHHHKREVTSGNANTNSTKTSSASSLRNVRVSERFFKNKFQQQHQEVDLTSSTSAPTYLAHSNHFSNNQHIEQQNSSGSSNQNSNIANKLTNSLNRELTKVLLLEKENTNVYYNIPTLSDSLQSTGTLAQLAVADANMKNSNSRKNSNTQEANSKQHDDSLSNSQDTKAKLKSSIPVSSTNLKRESGGSYSLASTNSFQKNSTNKNTQSSSLKPLNHEQDVAGGATRANKSLTPVERTSVPFIGNHPSSSSSHILNESSDTMDTTMVNANEAGIANAALKRAPKRSNSISSDSAQAQSMEKPVFSKSLTNKIAIKNATRNQMHHSRTNSLSNSYSLNPHINFTTDTMIGQNTGIPTTKQTTSNSKKTTNNLNKSINNISNISQSNILPQANSKPQQQQLQVKSNNKASNLNNKSIK